MRRLASVATVVSLAIVGVAVAPHNAKAWWQGGFGIGIAVPPVVIGPPPRVYYAPPAVAYAPPPAYYPPPRRVWVPAHWSGPYWIRGHWS